MIPEPGGNHLLLFVEKSLKKPENHLPGYRRSGHLPEKLAYEEALHSASLPEKPLLPGCPRSGHLPDKLSPSRNIGVKLDRCVLPHAFDLELRLRQ